MELRRLHEWDLSPEEAVSLQRRLAPQIVRSGTPQAVSVVAGSDIALGPRWQEGPAQGAVVALDSPSMTVIEESVVQAAVTFPYIPGLLSFREIPVLSQAFRNLRSTPDLLLVDGQGIAHPRRFGIACHLGLLLDLPTIGCAKSRLVGRHEALPNDAGAWVPLYDQGEVIGAVVRTRSGVKPIYVSVGHKIGLESAVEWVLRCCRGRRLPEPTRLADQRAGRRDLTA